MDVFGIAATAGGDALRAAAIAAAHELGVFGALAAARAGIASDAVAAAIGMDGGRRAGRVRALLDVLAAIGAIRRDGDRFAAAAVTPARTDVIRAGWGLIADVIRDDRPLPAPDADGARRFHAHLFTAGAAAACELALRLGGGPLLDLGGGAGAYTAAFLDAHPDAHATIVDDAPILALAAERLARFGERAALVAGDARTTIIDDRGVALLANVLHLHAPDACAELCAAAARAVRPGGLVVIKDLRVDVGRTGPLDGLLFALNMAIYTEAGDVYDTPQLRAWLAAAGLVEIEEVRLSSSPDAIVLIGRRPAAAADTAAAAVAAAATSAWQALVTSGTLHASAAAAGPPRLALPAPLRGQLSRAIAIERAEASATSLARAAALERHYLDVMPRLRIAQLAGTAEPGASIFHAALDWRRLPRLAGALDRLFALLADAGADPVAALGAPTAAAFRARTPTLAALYARTHYGGAMPLLYGYPADLVSFHARGAAAGLDRLGTIDRYLTAPIIHELCHFAPDRAALEPLHLDECVGGWLGVHAHPEFAYPAPGHDDAIFAAPWLAQVGQAIARAFGLAAVVRAHAGTIGWAASVPPAFVAAAARLGRDDWRARRTLHLLSDTLAPAPWVALALLVAAGRSVADATIDSLARTSLVELAGALPIDDAFDRAIVGDGVRAMCVDNGRVGGAFCVRMAVPDAAIIVDATACTVTTARRGEVDTIAPSYWLPPAVAARMLAAGVRRSELQLARVDAVDDAVEAIYATTAGIERAGFAIVARR